MTSNLGVNRRDFFKIAASGGAGLALASCNNDGVEDIIPKLLPPDNMVTGTPYHFNTICRECSSGCGITLKTREGRVLTAAGNEKHPINKGAICPVGQASVQGLYNPARIKKPILKGEETAWEDALKALAEQIKSAKAAGKKIVLLTAPETGVLSDLTDEFLTQTGGERLELDVNADNTLRLVSEKLFGVYEKPAFHFDRARVLINFGSDFLESWNTPTENAKKFAEMYSYKDGRKARFYHVSHHLNLTGSNADTWLSCHTGTEVYIAYLLISAVLDKSALPEGQKSAVREITGKYDLATVSELTGVSESVLKELTETVAGSGQVLAVAGGNAVADLSAYNLQYAVMLYNYVAGNVNSLLTYGHENFKHRTDIRKIQALFDDAEAGNVGVLITNNVNPAYVFAGRAAAFDKIGFSAAISVSSDETTEKSALVLPSLHFIESWGDDRSRKGVFALQQPAMAPVPGYDAKQTGDILLQLSALLGLTLKNAAPTYKEYLKAMWLKTAAENKQPADEAFWLTALQNGGMFLPSAPVNVNLSGDFSGKAAKDESPANPEGLKLSIANSVFHNASGQTGDKLWLLEIPHPMTQIVWDSWAEINADKAIELGINHGDEVEVSTAYGKAVLGAYVYHGVSKNAVVIPAGMGRKVLFPNYSQRRNMFLPFTSDNSKQLKYLKVGENAAELTGFNLNSTGTDLVLSGIDVQIKKTGKKAGFVSLDGQYRDDKEALIADSKANYGDRGQKDREIVRSATPEEVSTGNFEGGGHHLKPRNYTVDSRNQRDFYKPVPETVKESIFFKQPNDNPTYYDPYKFEMAVDLDKCTGCSSCVVACYAENNIPVVGKERQGLGREMSWIRIERFFDKDENGGYTANMIPTMCQHCENAGCEPVCPVYATYHNPDGLNVQVYNRCVGTRYCSNNCIYKQRRFNWRTYEFPEPLHMQLNPDVTVRTKGVMEKCTFCVQRVTYAKDKAKDEGRNVRDGEIVTACQAACPSSAITFGNAIDTESAVSIKKQDNRHYQLFEDVNFKPSVTYLKKVRHKKPVVS